MTAQTVGFAIADKDRDQLDALVEHFAGGNRSEFLRQALKRMRHEVWAETMRRIQANGREGMGGHVYTREETSALIKHTLSNL